MEEPTIISRIEDIGLSNKEARVYVAALQTGPASVQRIADLSGIKRVTTYVILESLIGMGLVSQSTKGKKTYFIAEDPTNLGRILEKRETELVEQRGSFDQVLPKLLSLTAVPKEAPEVKYFDSVDGIRSLYSSFYAYKGGGKLVRGMSNMDQIDTFFPEIGAKQVNQDRIKYHIFSHILYTTKKGPIYHETDDSNQRESRFVPIEEYPISGNLSILDDKVIILSLSGNNPIGVSITSHEIAQSMKTLFDMAWDRTATKAHTLD